MNKRGEILISSYIIGILIFVMVIVGGLSIIGEIGKTDTSWIDAGKYNQFNSSFNRYREILAETNGLQNSSTSSNSAVGTAGYKDSLVMSSWNNMRLIFSALGFMTDVYNSLSAMFGIPFWIIALLIAVISISLIAAIWRGIFWTKM